MNSQKTSYSEEKPLAFFFGEKVRIFISMFMKIHFEDNHFGIFIILPLHRESLRQMINQGRVNHSVKINVLRMLKKHVCGEGLHGDIKDSLVSHCWKIDFIWKLKKKPENILVDYDFNGATVSSFKCCLSDWGTAGLHYGGTPMYAGPRTYRRSSKDLFSFARLALELFLEPEGIVNTFWNETVQKLECVVHKWKNGFGYHSSHRRIQHN